MKYNYGKYLYTDDYSDIPGDLREKISEKANLFYSETYYNFTRRYGHKVIYFYSNTTILMAEIHKKFFFQFMNLPSEPFEYGKGAEEDMQEFMDSFMAVCRKMRVDWVGPTAATALFHNSPTDSLKIPFGSHVIDLTLDKDALWSHIHSKHRNVIRNAEKKDVRVVQGGVELLDDYIRIDRDTWARSGRTSNIKDECIKLLNDMPEYTRIYMSYYEGEPQSGAIFLRNREMSYYMYGASKDNPLTGAANYLHWVAINDAKEQGIRRYSFVGCRIGEDENSKYHGIQRFKERFGGDLIQGYMFKTVLVPWKYTLFRLMFKIKNHRPMMDVIDQEIGKWSELNTKQHH